jgi:hypothetical protein
MAKLNWSKFLKISLRISLLIVTAILLLFVASGYEYVAGGPDQWMRNDPDNSFIRGVTNSFMIALILPIAAEALIMVVSIWGIFELVFFVDNRSKEKLALKSDAE